MGNVFDLQVLRSVYKLIIDLIGLAWHMIWFIQYLWSNGVGQNKETDEKHNENCVEERFQLARVWEIVLSIFKMDQNWD